MDVFLKAILILNPFKDTEKLSTEVLPSEVRQHPLIQKPAVLQPNGASYKCQPIFTEVD